MRITLALGLPMLLALALAALCGPAWAEASGDRADLWDIPFGTPAKAITGRFGDFACGTDGGPPSLPISGFADFARCPPRPDGLTEVYFRYDEDAAYVARALDRPGEAARIGGTTAFGFPVVTSLLFDSAGTVRGKLVVSDPRPENATARPRHEFWTLGNLLRAQFARDNWECADLPLRSGEHAGGAFSVKRSCTVTNEGLSYRIEQHFLQRAGQSFVDPHTGALRPDDFESVTRFEILSGADHAQ